MSALRLVSSNSPSAIQQPAQPVRTPGLAVQTPAQSPASMGAEFAYGATGRSAVDSVSVPQAIEGQASPDMASALRAAEQARDELLSKGIVPNMSAMDAARLMALLG